MINEQSMVVHMILLYISKKKSTDFNMRSPVGTLHQQLMSCDDSINIAYRLISMHAQGCLKVDRVADPAFKLVWALDCHVFSVISLHGMRPGSLSLPLYALHGYTIVRTYLQPPTGTYHEFFCDLISGFFLTFTVKIH
jgi:hypothetical protein